VPRQASAGERIDCKTVYLVMPDTEVLNAIQQRILWLAVRMVDEANRRDAGGIKVGGHQASSASMVTLMTALWFGHISGEDKVAVKPHASPVYHAIKYLTGELAPSYLTRLRAMGGLQAYPSRTKDPDVADFSTGSVGLGAVAPLFSAAVRRYVDQHFGRRPRTRFIAIAGDAELDEGNVWEAISDSGLQGLGNVMLVVDLNRQSLDRVVPGMQAERLRQFFENAGWHIAIAKYGHILEEAFARPGGEPLRKHIDEMSNEEYQSLFAVDGPELRQRFLAGAGHDLKEFLDQFPDAEIGPLVRNLGGHDLEVLLRTFQECEEVDDRPSVVLAYTIKGWGLPIAGKPLNHTQMLTGTQIDELRCSVGLEEDTEWDRFDPESLEGQLCARIGAEVNNQPVPPRPRLNVPTSAAQFGSRATSSQDAFGRILVALGRIEGVRDRIVTTSPDVSISTNLGGWINVRGVFAPQAAPDYMGSERFLRWQPGPEGQHLELGISEMNLFMLLGQMGLSHEHHGEMLLPIGTVYDPFVLRGLDALIYGLYNGGRFIIVGTPSGVTLAPEGGAHQSTITPSVGLELPGIVACEPAYAEALDWLLCDGLDALSNPDGESLYLRLSTRPIDQEPFIAARERLGVERLRADVLAGGYRLREPGAGEPLVLAASGAVMPEVLAAADLLQAEEVGVTVLDLTSSDRMYRSWRSLVQRAGQSARVPVQAGGHMALLLTQPERSAPIVTVHDAASHSLAWMGSVFGQPVVPVGVDRFGESGSIPDLYRTFDLDPEAILHAGLVALHL
jgi:pyruvate dehydrogenase E1 component